MGEEEFKRWAYAFGKSMSPPVFRELPYSLAVIFFFFSFPSGSFWLRWYLIISVGKGHGLWLKVLKGLYGSCIGFRFRPFLDFCLNKYLACAGKRNEGRKLEGRGKNKGSQKV